MHRDETESNNMFAKTIQINLNTNFSATHFHSHISATLSLAAVFECHPMIYYDFGAYDLFLQNLDEIVLIFVINNIVFFALLFDLIFY